MKKLVFLLPCIFLCGILLAQDNIDINDLDSDSIETNIESYTESTIDDILEDSVDNEINDNIESNENENGDDSNSYGGKLGDIFFGFCDKGNDNLSSSYNAAIEQGKTQEICMSFHNNGDKDTLLHLDYSKLGQDQFGNDVCSIDTSFEEFVENIDQIKTLIIPAGEVVQTSLKLFFPIGIEGNQGGCVTFYVDKQPGENGGGGFTLTSIVKRGYMMKFFVGAVDDITNEIKIGDIKAELNSNKELILKFNLANVGNLEDSLIITGNISNIFGYNKEFEINGGHVLPDRTLPVEANIGTIASYGGLFSININVNSTPFFSYDISNSSIDPTLLESKEFTASTTFFQMPWLILIIVIIVILLIITIFRKPKQNVVYVQAPQQQPMPNNGYQQPQYQAPQQPQPQQPQYPNNSQYGQPMQQNPQPTPPQYNPNN